MAGIKSTAVKYGKIKIMLFHMPQKSIPNLKLIISGSIIEHVTEF